MDEVKYREHKILLAPNRLQTTADFSRFWEKVKAVAAKSNVSIDAEPRSVALSVRRVSFYDTKTFDLYRNAFILRKRVHYVASLPTDHELTFKFRHPDLGRAQAIDIRPTDEGRSKIKFKEEVMQPRDGAPGLRSVYSHNYVDEMRDLTIRRRFGALAEQFPVLATLGASNDAAIVLVNDRTVEEQEAKTGTLHFGHGYTADSSIAVWLDAGTRAPIAGEFSFQSRFESLGAIDPAAKQRSERFFLSLQSDLPKWLAPGATKTSLIYGAGVGHE